MKEQVLVLISRTPSASDLIFVGESPESTAKTLVSLLQSTTPYSRYMEHIVDVMSGVNNAEIVALRPLNFLPYNLRNIAVPHDCNGYVYCLLSLKDMASTYIGSTNNLCRRVNEHNSLVGGGAEATRNANLKPWICIAFIYGFSDVKGHKELLERKWFQTRSKRGKFILSPWRVLLIGKELVSIARRKGDLRLSFVQCIELKEQADI
jgi:hypothetical protein